MAARRAQVQHGEAPARVCWGLQASTTTRLFSFRRAFALDCEYTSYARTASFFICAVEMSHGTRFGATRDFKRHTLKKKFRRGGHAANQFRRDAWRELLREVNKKAHNHLGSRMGRCARNFGPFPRLPLVSCLRLQLLQKRHVKRRARHTENEFGPCKSPGASLLRYVGRARRQPRRKHPIGPQKQHFSGTTGRHCSRGRY